MGQCLQFSIFTTAEKQKDKKHNNGHDNKMTRTRRYWKHTSLPWLLKREAMLARKAACMDPKLGILHPLPEVFWSICKENISWAWKRISWGWQQRMVAKYPKLGILHPLPEVFWSICKMMIAWSWQKCKRFPFHLQKWYNEVGKRGWLQNITMNTTGLDLGRVKEIWI